MSDTTPSHNELGKLLRAFREERKLSREALVTRILLTTGYRLSASHVYRIERGRCMPSANALGNIVDGLNLDHTAKERLYSLISDNPLQTQIPVRETVSEEVRRVVQLQHPGYAYVIDRRMNILHETGMFCEVYGLEFDALDERERNLAWLIFGNRNISARLRDWETHARATVAFCRYLWAGYSGRQSNSRYSPADAGGVSPVQEMVEST